MKRSLPNISHLGSACWCLSLLLSSVLCQIRIEDSKWWPIPEDTEIESKTRSASFFYSLKLDLTTYKKCPDYTIRHRDDRISNTYICRTIFAHCAFVNDDQERCQKCIDGFKRIRRPGGLVFCVEKNWMENNFIFDQFWFSLQGALILYGIWLFIQSFIKRRRAVLKERRKEDQ